MKITVNFDFCESHLIKARRWAREHNRDYKDDRLLLIDALENGIFALDYVKIGSIK